MNFINKVVCYCVIWYIGVSQILGPVYQFLQFDVAEDCNLDSSVSISAVTI